MGVGKKREKDRVPGEKNARDKDLVKELKHVQK
jgi:hypothetical protein